MDSKKFFSVLFSILLAFSLNACSDDSDSDDDGGGSVSQQEAQTVLVNAMTAIYNAMSEITYSKATQVATINYSGTGWSATGSISYDNDPITGPYPWIYDLTFTWSGYTYQDVTLSSGTVYYYYNVPSATQATYEYSGDFVAVCDGVTYNISWEIDVTYSNGATTYSGTYTVNGSTYSWSDSYSK